MISLKSRTKIEFLNHLTLKNQKFPTELDADDIQESLEVAVREFNDLLFNSRRAMIDNPAQDLDLTLLSVDEIVYVFFPIVTFEPHMKDIGLIPLISRTMPLLDMESVGDFLLFKGNLNLMDRHLKFAPDWEYTPPMLHLNKVGLARIIIEYLPYIDPLVDSWFLYENEYNFIIEYAWILINIKNAEALSNSAYLGVGNEYANILTYWDNKKKEVWDKFTKSKVLTYFG